MYKHFRVIQLHLPDSIFLEWHEMRRFVYSNIVYAYVNIVSRSLSYYFLSVSLSPSLPPSPCLPLPLPLSCSLSVIILIIRLSVCLSFCLTVGLSARSFVRLFIFPSACNSILTLKRRNGISVSFSSCGKNSNRDD